MNRLALAGLCASLLLPVAGCSIFGAASGTAADCSGAEKDLADAKAALALAQIALTNAEALGNGKAIALAQAAVNMINADVTAIQALVGQTCGSSAAHPALRVGASVTLAQAKRLASADQKLAAALRAPRR